MGWRPVRQELLLGRLKPGEQLPTVKEVVDALAVNPNTVTKAYRELEHEGLVSSRQGLGTFVAASPPPRWRPGRAVGIADPLGAPGPRRGTRG